MKHTKKMPGGGRLAQQAAIAMAMKKAGKKPKMAKDGLKVPSDDQKGLKKLPKEVRNKMGYAKDGMKVKGKKGLKVKGIGLKKAMGGMKYKSAGKGMKYGK